MRLAAVLPGKQTVPAAIGAVLLVAAAVGVYATADTSSGEVEELAFAAMPLPTTTTTTTTTIAPPPTTEGDGAPAGPLIDPSTFGDERPTSVVGGVLFDLLTDPEIGVAPNVANCAIETLATRITDEELLALGAATGEPAAVEPVAQAALDCGITQNQIDRAVAKLRNEPLPPVEETVTEETAPPAEPEVDLSGFSEERPTDLVQGTVFDLLVGGGDNNYVGQERRADVRPTAPSRPRSRITATRHSHCSRAATRGDRERQGVGTRSVASSRPIVDGAATRVHPAGDPAVGA